MGMTEIIHSMGYTSFGNCMNPPEDGWDGVADAKIFPDGSEWIVCPFCHKKAVKVLPDTKIHKMPWKCRNSKCGEHFLINV